VDYGAHAVSLGVTSKTYGLAGCASAGPPPRTARMYLYEKMASLKDYTTICNSAPSEFLAEVALRHREKLANRNIYIIKHNLAIIDDLFFRYSSLFAWHRPKAGSMGFPKLLQGTSNPSAMTSSKKQACSLLPGSVYDDLLEQPLPPWGWGARTFRKPWRGWRDYSPKELRDMT
jgi:aspartate/methionine/tyrosine aminotransferase